MEEIAIAIGRNYWPDLQKKTQVRTSLGKRDPATLPPPWQKQERHGFQHDSMARVLQSGGFAFSQERSFHEALLSLRGTKG